MQQQLKNPAQFFTVELEQPSHSDGIEDLHHRAFGPGRFAKTAFRLREGVSAVPELCLVGFDRDGTLQGSVRFTPISIAGEEGFLLLGPLAVEPELRGKGLGVLLMETSLSKATEMGYKGVVLVGDLPYYARVGFEMANPFVLTLDGPVDPNRLLIKALQPGAFESVEGLISKAVGAV